VRVRTQSWVKAGRAREAVAHLPQAVHALYAAGHVALGQGLPLLRLLLVRHLFARSECEHGAHGGVAERRVIVRRGNDESERRDGQSCPPLSPAALSLPGGTYLVGTVLGGAEHVREEDATVVAVRDVVPRQLLVLSPQSDGGEGGQG